MSITKNYTVENTTFSIMIDDVLTDLDRKVLTHLYLPLIGDKALSIYLTMYTLIDTRNNESGIINHHQLLKMVNLFADDFVYERTKLEALGLLSTYYYDQMYVYVLKKVLSPYEFFENKTLVKVLSMEIGEEDVQNLSYDFLVKSIDLNCYENITSHFDDVFMIVSEDDIDYTKAGINSKNNGIVISNDSFNTEYFILLVEAMDLLDKEILYDNEFLDLMKRYAFLYSLTPEQLKDALKNAVNFEKKLVLEDLDYWVRKSYDERLENKKIVPKKTVVNSSNKLINFLNTASPNDIVKAKYQTALTSSEIAMFDRVLKETNVSLGILNAAVLYVLVEKNGAIPPANYFVKVINTWLRAGVDSASAALDYINNQNIKSQNKPKQSVKKVKETPKWYNEVKQEESNIKDDNDELVDIVDFFKPNN